MAERILVVGAGGFVGLHLIRALSSRGDKVIAVSRCPIDQTIAPAENILTQLTDPAQYARLLDQCDAVAYLASCSTPGTSAGRPVDELLGNLLPLTTLLQAMQEKPATRLLYLSSGGSLYAESAVGLATESSPIQPRSYHGAAKAAAEHLIAAWCLQYSRQATLVRPSNIYGPGQIERPGFGIVPACFGKIVRGESLQVWGDGSVVRDYLYIDDFVELCIAILSNPAPAGVLTINASSGVGTSLDELFRTIETVTGKPLTRSYELNRAVDASRIVMDPNVARSRYDWMPATPLEEGLKKTWDWFNNTPR